MCLFKVLKANRVNLWHTCFLGVLRCAESKSAVCQAQKWPLSPQNGPFKDGGHHYDENPTCWFLGVYAHAIPQFRLIVGWGIHFWYCFDHFRWYWPWKVMVKVISAIPKNLAITWPLIGVKTGAIDLIQLILTCIIKWWYCFDHEGSSCLWNINVKVIFPYRFCLFCLFYVYI